jgi:O-antigen ligase
VLAFVVGLSQRSKYKRIEAFSHPALVGLGTLWIAQVLSAYYVGVAGMLDEFNIWNVYLLFVVVSVLLISSEKALRRYLGGAMAGGAFLIGFGIYAKYNNFQTERVLIWYGMAGAYGMYENHNDYSFIIVQSFPYFVYYFREAKGFFLKLFLGASTIASLWGIAVSLSRGGAIAVALEVAMLIAFLTKGAKRVTILLVFSVVAIVAVQLQFSTRAERQGDNYTEADSENSREELWKAGWQMFLAHPILGVGSRRFGEFARDYGELSHDNIGKNAHNTYIEVLATTGLLGFLGLCSMIFYAIRELRRLAPAGTPRALIAIQKATLVAFIAISFRSFLDSKVFDLGFYFLSVMTVTTGLLIRASAPESAQAPQSNQSRRDASPTAASRFPPRV